MIYFANPSTPQIRAAMASTPHLGVIVTPAQGNHVGELGPVCVDNGCFTNPDGFDPVSYRALCEGVRWCNPATFATVPDVVGDWAATLTRWDEFDRTDWPCPLAIVLQDGATPATVPWDEAGAVFVGGSTEWKLSGSAAGCVQAANQRGLWTHMGRVNSMKRLRYAKWIGCDSADGTYLTFGPDINLPKLLRWLRDVNQQQTLVEFQ